MAPSRALVFAVLVLVQVGFAGYNILVKKYAQGEKADPLVFSALRDVFAFPLLLGAAIVLEGAKAPTTGPTLLMFLVLGATGMLGNQLFFILGLYLTSPSVAAIMQPIIPIFTAIFSMWVGLEPLPNLKTPTGSLKVVGIVAAVCGAMVMAGTAKAAAGQQASLAGVVCLLLNTSCMAIYVVTQKLLLFADLPSESATQLNPLFRAFWRLVYWLRPQCKQYATAPINVTAWSYMFGALLMGLCTLYYIPNSLEKFHVPNNTLIPLAYAAVISSAICYGCISWANRHLDPSLVTAVWPLQVPSVAVLSFFVFGDVPTALQCVGGILIAFGLLTVTWADYKLRQSAVDSGTTYQPLGDD